GACEVRLTLTPEERDDLRRVQDLLSHREWARDAALVYAKAIKLYAEHLLDQKLGKTKGADASECVGNGRHIPMPVRRAVWERDGGSCSFLGDKSHRCGETRWLQFDHRVPLARGGRSTLENVRLLCRAHNQHEAERVLGREHVHTRRELAHRDRSRSRAAAQASAVRDVARCST
ncbi:MAG: HNH endonuclease, partial [Candidatus Eisenbacteria bacterium]|nr:HNH endonuclease [Candidatus Eisenbacteria bacterium]